MKLLGLRTVIYPSVDLQVDKQWWAEALGYGPHFDEPYYVGFDIGGYELGLLPAKTLDGGPKTYWGVEDMPKALKVFTDKGCKILDRPLDVGEGIIVASVKRPNGQIIGLIKNPLFKAK